MKAPSVPRGRGGKRPGAGGKPNYLKRLGIEPLTAAKILAHVDELDLWKGLLFHKNPNARLSTLQYLTDRRDGKPRQALEVSGALLQAHVTYRNPVLAGLSADELAALDAITRKLALPAAAADTSQDGPHNQIESKPATLAPD